MSELKVTGGLPLDEFTKSTPPGWRPGLAKYPYRKYLQKLKLWWRQTDLSESQCGPAIAGRLQGGPFQIANRLRQTRVDLITLVSRDFLGDELLAQPSNEEVKDPSTGTVLVPAQAAGASILVERLTADFGVHDDDHD